jgi:hypothetical protein
MGSSRACVKKVFEMLCIPRAQASNATMDSSLTSQCASYLWALAQAHKVMREFVDTRFRNHGAIALVMVLHIFKLEYPAFQWEPSSSVWKGD